MSPKVKTITENVETIEHWFSTENRYSYIMEFTNGSTWKKQTGKYRWEKMWKVGDQIIIIGNSQQIGFINKTALEPKIHSSIDLTSNVYQSGFEKVQ
jgi:hypothetical protein